MLEHLLGSYYSSLHLNGAQKRWGKWNPEREWVALYAKNLPLWILKLVLNETAFADRHNVFHKIGKSRQSLEHGRSTSL